ncbi:MAG: hypothetical protein ACREOE_08620 [Gemmatimonadales bacterium]
MSDPPPVAVASPTRGPSPAPSTTAATHPCQAGEVGAGAVWWTGATATQAGGFVLFDVGPAACSIGGRVAVQLLDRGGTPLPIEVRPFETSAPTDVTLLPDLGVPNANDNPTPGRAGVETFWTNWCGPLPLGSGTLVVTIPGIGQLTASFAGLSAPRCDAPGSLSILEVSPIIPSVP